MPRRRRQRPPKMVLLDIRQESRLERYLFTLDKAINDLTAEVQRLRDQIQILSLENERRSTRAKKANETRRQAGPADTNGIHHGDHP